MPKTINVSRPLEAAKSEHEPPSLLPSRNKQADHVPGLKHTCVGAIPAGMEPYDGSIFALSEEAPEET